jgi:hypothetical protein
VIGAASMIVSTDLRNMSSFMRATLMDAEMLAIHQDAMGISGGVVMHDTTSDGCSAEASVTSPRHQYFDNQHSGLTEIYLPLVISYIDTNILCDAEQVSDYCQVWARPLEGGRWAMALYNRVRAHAVASVVSWPLSSLARFDEGGAADEGWPVTRSTTRRPPSRAASRRSRRSRPRHCWGARAFPSLMRSVLTEIYPHATPVLVKQLRVETPGA